VVGLRATVESALMSVRLSRCGVFRNTPGMTPGRVVAVAGAGCGGTDGEARMSGDREHQRNSRSERTAI